MINLTNLLSLSSFLALFLSHFLPKKRQNHATKPRWKPSFGSSLHPEWSLNLLAWHQRSSPPRPSSLLQPPLPVRCPHTLRSSHKKFTTLPYPHHTSSTCGTFTPGGHQPGASSPFQGLLILALLPQLQWSILSTHSRFTGNCSRAFISSYQELLMLFPCWLKVIPPSRWQLL